MNKMARIITLLTILVIVLFGIPACGQRVSPEQTVPQEEYDKIVKQLGETESQLTSLQNKAGEAKVMETLYQELSVRFEELKRQNELKTNDVKNIQAKYDDLIVRYEELKKQGSTIGQAETLQVKYDKLKTDFDELKKQYDIIIKGTAIITVEEIEKAMFESVNKERSKNGLDELSWGKNLQWWAKENSRSMAETGEYKYSLWASWQEIYWAAGYGTRESIVRGALIIWKANQYRYERNIINKVTPYGAVGAYKSGEILYITYMASTFP